MITLGHHLMCHVYQMHPKRFNIVTFVRQKWTFILIKHQSVHTNIVSYDLEG
jgi:hypothetical protein